MFFVGAWSWSSSAAKTPAGFLGLKIHSFSGHSSFIFRLFIGITGDHWGMLVDSHLVGGAITILKI